MTERVMKCCSAQIAAVWEQPQKTVKKAERCISDAASAGASLVCFPEQFATGWDPMSGQNIEGMDGRTVIALQALAREHSVAIIGSFRERSAPHPKNTAVAVGTDGEILAAYSKIHLFSPAHEDKAFTPGTGPASFTLDGVRCGIAICYDLRFPPLFSTYAKTGVQAVFVPAAWPESRTRHWELVIAARAAENRMYVAGVNATGTNPVDRYSGASMTADPEGKIIARAGDREELLFFEVDPSAVDALRRRFPVGTGDKNSP
jgi:predicted amidohydrolase